MKSTILTEEAMLASMPLAMQGTCNSLNLLSSFSDGLSAPASSCRPRLGCREHMGAATPAVLSTLNRVQFEKLSFSSSGSG